MEEPGLGSVLGPELVSGVGGVVWAASAGLPKRQLVVDQKIGKACVMLAAIRNLLQINLTACMLLNEAETWYIVR